MATKAPVEFIPGYQHPPRQLDIHTEYWSADRKVFTPLNKVKLAKNHHHEIHKVLDSIALAVEAGVVPKNGWLKFFFGTPKAFEAFMDQFRSYDECFRINDRWWDAFQTLVDTGEEYGFITCEEIANTLREDAELTGQLKPSSVI